MKVDPRLDILFEDQDLLVVNKPADLVCHPTKGDEYSSLISRIRLHLGNENPAHLVNRIDRETTGLVLVAKTDISNRQLRILFQDRRVEKEYQAIVYGHPVDDCGLIDAALGSDEKSEVTIRDCVRADGASSQTEYVVERRFERSEGAFALLRVRPATGRKHQIRIHLGHIGHPIVGDKLYGLEERFYLDFIYDRLTSADWGRLILPNQALHAELLKFVWQGRAYSFRADPDIAFSGFLAGEPVLQIAHVKPVKLSITPSLV
ncbi:MAG: RluA family pseudouridine synthase [Pedosphaera sp.]|nr:RluA family pseudouridine synthase [Pedosphaera sp.]